MAECAPVEMSTASTSSSVAATERKLKCRKCRHQLLQQPPQQLVEEEEEKGPAAEAAAVYSLQEDLLPDWINTAVEQVRLKVLAVVQFQAVHPFFKEPISSIRTVVFSPFSFVLKYLGASRLRYLSLRVHTHI
jgi:hypothetical protein